MKTVASTFAASIALSVLVACSASTTRDAATAGALAHTIHQELPAWIADPADGWDHRDEPATVFFTARASRHGEDGARAESRAYEQVVAATGAFLRQAVGRLNASYIQGLGAHVDDDTREALIDDRQLVSEVVADALDRRLHTASREPRVVGKWLDDDGFHVRLRYDAAVAFLPAYFQHLSDTLGGLQRSLTDADQRRLTRELENLVGEVNAGAPVQD